MCFHATKAGNQGAWKVLSCSHQIRALKTLVETGNSTSCFPINPKEKKNEKPPLCHSLYLFPFQYLFLAVILGWFGCKCHLSKIQNQNPKPKTQKKEKKNLLFFNQWWYSIASSGGEEDYDSSFMNSSSRRRRTDNPHLSNPSQITNFETLSNYFDSISSRPLPPPLLDMSSWSKSLRSDPNPNSSPTDHISPAMICPPPSSISSFFGAFSATTATPPQPISAFSPNLPGIEANSTPPIAASNANNISASATNSPRPASDHHPNPPRNPKKRSRASRRAPTTVLTTDTTNFRAMVQEFTGIPAPPFTSSPFSRAARLDLYCTNPSSMRSNPLLDSSQSPSYLRRSFPQKVQLPPPPPPLPLPPFIASSSSAAAAPWSSSSPLVNSGGVVSLDQANNNIVSTSEAINNLPSNHPILSSGLLQSKFPGLNPPPIISGLEIPSKESQLKVGGLFVDQFGHVNMGSLSGLTGLISAYQTTSRSSNNNENDNNPVNWDGNGSLNLARMNAATNGKMGYSSSATNSSSFHGNKGPESG